MRFFQLCCHRVACAKWSSCRSKKHNFRSKNNSGGTTLVLPALF